MFGCAAKRVERRRPVRIAGSRGGEPEVKDGAD
jgi:hypothetical protein